MLGMMPTQRVEGMHSVIKRHLRGLMFQNFSSVAKIITVMSDYVDVKVILW